MPVALLPIKTSHVQNNLKSEKVERRLHEIAE